MYYQEERSGGLYDKQLLLRFYLIGDKCQDNGDYAQYLADDDCHAFTLVSIKLQRIAYRKEEQMSIKIQEEQQGKISLDIRRNSHYNGKAIGV